MSGPDATDGSQLNYHMGGDFRKLPDRIEDIIADACKGTPIDPNLMCRICCVESGGNPKAFRKDTQVAGLFQFKEETARKYGLSPQERFDPVKCTRAAVAHMMDLYDAASDILGREPLPHELYICHQQGAAGGLALLKNLERNAIDVLRPFYNSTKTAASAILKNGGEAYMTAKEFLSVWAGRFGDAVAHPQPGRPQGMNDVSRIPDIDDVGMMPEAEDGGNRARSRSQGGRRVPTMEEIWETAGAVLDAPDNGPSGRKNGGRQGKRGRHSPDADASPVGGGKGAPLPSGDVRHSDPELQKTTPPLATPPPAEESGGITKVFQALSSLFSPRPDTPPAEMVDTRALQQASGWNPGHHEPAPPPASPPRPATSPHHYGFGSQ